MDSETIYTVLLDQPRKNGENTVHGFSYRLKREDDGSVIVKEIGPNQITIYEADGPELDALDEATVKAAIEAALPVDEAYVIPPPPTPYVEKVTAETAVSAFFSPYQIAALQRLELALLQASKPLGPAMTAAKEWLEAVMLGWALNPTPAPQESFGQPQASFEEASAEAVAALQA